MRRLQGRVVAVLAAWLVAFTLVVSGVVAPAAAAVEGESSTTITMARDRWWDGEEETVAHVSVVRDGLPADGRLFVYLDGVRQLNEAVVSGQAQVALSLWALDPGAHVLEVVHGETPDRSTAFSVGTAAFRVDEPTTPVIAEPRMYGDPADVIVDLTGTDLPQHGEITLATATGAALGTGTMAGGIATVPVSGTAMTSLSSYRLAQRDSATGALISSWRLHARIEERPVTLTVETASTWRRGQEAKVVVRASDSLPVSGTVEIRRYLAPGSAGGIGGAKLVDGKATAYVDPELLPLGDRPIFAVLDSPTHAAPAATTTVTVKDRFDTWPRIDAGVGPWRYGVSRRVYFDVEAEDRAKLDGRIALSVAGKSLGTAAVVDGKASLLVGGKALEPGLRDLRFEFEPSVTTHQSSRWHQTVRIYRAAPTVRLTMDRTSYPVKANLGTSEAGTVRVSTAGLPERGRLVLETRSPRADISGWRTRSAVNWWLSTADKGVQRVKVPAKFLRTADGRPGRVYLRFRYIPADTTRVATAVSAAVTIRRY